MSNKHASLFSNTGSPPRIQSVGRIAAILEALRTAPGGVLQLNELARACGLVKTTAFTLADSLVCVGLVEREAAGGYRLGLRNLAFGREVERHLDVTALARPALLRLCALTRETVNLAVARPLEAFIVESFEGSHNLRVSSYAGTSAPYHSTACGRALLAFQAPAVIESFYQLGRFERFTEQTIVTVNALDAALADCRSRGWVVEREENEVGASCIAAPIFIGGVVQAAISIAAPAARLEEAQTTRFAEMLLCEIASIESSRATTLRAAPRAT